MDSSRRCSPKRRHDDDDEVMEDGDTGGVASPHEHAGEVGQLTPTSIRDAEKLVTAASIERPASSVAVVATVESQVDELRAPSPDVQKSAEARRAVAQTRLCCAHAKRDGVYAIVDGDEVCDECLKKRKDTRLVVHINGAQRTSGALKPAPNARALQAREAVGDCMVELLHTIDKVQLEDDT